MSKSAALLMVVLLALTSSIISVSIHESDNQLRNRHHGRIVPDSGRALETFVTSFIIASRRAQNSGSSLRFLKRIAKDTYMRTTLIFLLIFSFTQLDPDTIMFLALIFAGSVKAIRYKFMERGPTQLLEVIVLFTLQLMIVFGPNAKIGPMTRPVFVWPWPSVPWLGSVYYLKPRSRRYPAGSRIIGLQWTLFEREFAL
jgi:hypothetical protein